MTDIIMSLDDTLELDTIIKESSASDALTVTDGTERTDFNLNGIDTHTDIFSPVKSGTYNLDINGQKLTVKVTDPDTIPESGIERYTFDSADTSGSTVVGIWNGNNGILKNVTTGVSGVANTYGSREAYSFNGSSSEVNLPNLNADLKSISFWINPDTSMDGSSSFSVQIGFNPGVLIGESFGFNDISNRGIGINGGPQDTETSVGSSVSYSASKSHHFVFNWSSTDTKYEIYHNGIKEPVDSGSGGHAPLVTDQSSLSVGYRRSNNDRHDAGDIDDVRFYDKSLTDTEISDLYSTGSI